MEPYKMTPTEFKSWRKRVGLNQTETGITLGKTQQTISNYERGFAVIPPAIELATIGYEFREKANDLREMLAFVETEGISKKMPTLHDIKNAMRDPAYWRDQDPKVVEAVREAFRNLYLDEHPSLVEDLQEPIKRGFWT